MNDNQNKQFVKLLQIHIHFNKIAYMFCYCWTGSFIVNRVLSSPCFDTDMI